MQHPLLAVQDAIDLFGKSSESCRLLGPKFVPVVGTTNTAYDMPQGALGVIRTNAGSRHEGTRCPSKIVSRPACQWLGVGVFFAGLSEKVTVELPLELRKACDRLFPIGREHPSFHANPRHRSERGLCSLR